MAGTVLDFDPKFREAVTFYQLDNEQLWPCCPSIHHMQGFGDLTGIAEIKVTVPKQCHKMDVSQLENIVLS